MQNFLKEISAYILKNHISELHNICIIYPNKRAGVFLSKYMSELISKPVWMPGMFTINSFIQNYTDLTVADNFVLNYHLFNVYKTLKPGNETFDDFYYWGELLINDFDDIDKYLINPDDLFSNLKAVKEIEKTFNYLTDEQLEIIKRFWNNVQTEKLSKNKEDFISIWQILAKLYKNFNAVLLDKKIAYEGMIYRKVADQIKNEGLSCNYSKIIFLGFNALNKCEELVFEYFKKEKKAAFFWDYDNYYIKNTYHQAGYFLRNNLKNFPPPDLTCFDALLKPKNINAYSASSEIAQVKICEEILNGIDKKEHNQTAVILGDEGLLIPLIYSLPQNIDEYNITMGYPVKDTPLAGLIKNIIDLQVYLLKSKNKNRLYYKNVLNILNHQYISQIASNDKLINEIVRKNKLYINVSDIQSETIYKLIFCYVEKAENISEYIQKILLHIYHEINKLNSVEDKHDVENEYIYHFYLLFNRISNAIANYESVISLNIYWKIFSHLIKNLRIPFEGEPLAGLQIMGLLETRVLDFKNIIVLSLNEGKLPSTSVSSSFIPYNLRKGFGMQTIEHQEAIFAHAFYRLIQRAENIHLVYSIGSDFNNGEKSRFVNQLMFELGLKINDKIVNIPIDNPVENLISVNKSSNITDRLKRYLSLDSDQLKLSPSAINTYIDCSLKFYFRYIAGLKEPDEITEDVDNQLLGNLFHEVIHEIYKNLIGKTLDKSDFESIRNNDKFIHDAIIFSFNKHYFKDVRQDEPLKGKNILFYEIILVYIRQMIEKDAQYTPFTIIGLESEYKYSLPVILNGEEKKINFSGKIDRIDKKDNCIRILDYKTGNDKLNYKTMESLFESGNSKRNKAVFQTFVYSYLFIKNNHTDSNIHPGIIQVKNLYSEDTDFAIKHNPERGKSIPVDNFNAFVTDFENKVIETVTDIFNPEVSFTQVTDDLKICEYCPYKLFCRK
ncbi:MAG: PD-(D/E)XK nuclease family protein [Bacteroidota bacterium]